MRNNVVLACGCFFKYEVSDQLSHRRLPNPLSVIIDSGLCYWLLDFHQKYP